MESSRIEEKKSEEEEEDETTTTEEDEDESDEDDDDTEDEVVVDGKDKSKSLNSTLTTGGTNSPAADSGIGTSAGSKTSSNGGARVEKSSPKNASPKQEKTEVVPNNEEDEDSADYYYSHYDKALKKKDTRKVKSSMSIHEPAKTSNKSSEPRTVAKKSQVSIPEEPPVITSTPSSTPLDFSPPVNSNELMIKKKINEFNLLRKNLKSSQASGMLSSLNTSSSIAGSAKKRLPPLSRQKTDLTSAGTIRSSHFASASSVTIDTLNSKDYYPVNTQAGTTVAANANFKCSVTVDTSKARSNSEVLRMCINQLGWTECPFPSANQTSTCDIIWQSCTTHEGDLNSVVYYNQTSRVNKFPSKLPIFYQTAAKFQNSRNFFLFKT